MSDFYNLSARSLDGETVEFSRYAGKVVIVVNTASLCGFTPQYGELETLYKRYHDDGLEILAFPCNQFGNQEPGGVDDIKKTCDITYGVNFPVFEKIDVNGAHAHPVFVYLKAELPGMLGGKIMWNFTKFLVGRDGTPLKRFAPNTAPARMEPAIKKALGA